MEKVIYLGNEKTIFKWSNITELKKYAKKYDISIGNDADIGDNVYIGSMVDTGDNVNISNNVDIGDYISIGNDVNIGDNVYISSYVNIDHNTNIKEKSIIRMFTII